MFINAMCKEKEMDLSSDQDKIRARSIVLLKINLNCLFFLAHGEN